MGKASTDDSHANHGELLINTGTGGGTQKIPRPVIAAGTRAQHSRSLGGAIAPLVPWLVVTTGTNTASATGRGAQIAGGAGSVIADGATTAVNTNSAGAVDTGANALAKPWRTAGRAFSDQTIVPWALLRTGTSTMNAAHRGAQIAGGAGSVIATGAATVNTSSAGAINTTGALAQFSRTAGGAFSDQMPIPRQFALKTGTSVARASGIVIKAKPGSTITFGPGAQIVIADGASAVNTSSAAAVNIYEDGCSNIYYSAVVTGTTRLMTGFGLGMAIGSSKKLGAGVAVAVGFSLKRKVRSWAARMLKKTKDE